MRAILNTFRFCLILGFVIIATGCASNPGVENWSQFHADGQSQGFRGVDSGPAIAPIWSTDVGSVAHSSPVISKDGTIYLGTVDGELVAVNPDGTIKCSVEVSEGIIQSSPAIGDDYVYIISTRKISDNNFSSALHQITSDCETSWFYPFPSITPDARGNTSASPKILETEKDLYIFVPVRSTRPRDTADNDDVEDGFNEIFVFNQNGDVVDRKTIGGCARLSGGGSDLSGFFSDVWEFITDFPDSSAVIGDAYGPLYEQFGWLDPTAAIATLPTITEPDKPLVIVADNCLGLRLTGFHWRLDQSFPRLNRIWTYDDKSNKRFYSSPAIFSNGLLVIGREDGFIQGIDPETGNKLWDQNVGEAVMATPASFGRQIFFNSLRRLHVLEANGDFADVPVVSTYIGGQSIASPAISADFVYFNTTAGLLTRSFDFYTRANDVEAVSGLSSPAIGKDGTIYTVIIENGSSKLLAYGTRD